MPKKTPKPAAKVPPFLAKKLGKKVAEPPPPKKAPAKKGRRQ